MSRNIEAAIVAAGAGLLYMGLDWLMSSNETIELIETEEKCTEAVAKLRSHCSGQNVLGFDCEWVGTRRVALLQLCSSKGYCALFRLNHIGMPRCLADLLRNPKITKVGVEPLTDAQRLKDSYDIPVNATLDLRFLAVMTGYKPQNLGDMYKEVIGKDIGVNMARTDWEAVELSSDQINYAAKDAIAGIQIFDALIKKFPNLTILEDYMDTRFSLHRHNNLPRVDGDCVLQ